MTGLHDHNPPAPLTRRRFSVPLGYGAWALLLLASALGLLGMGGSLGKWADVLALISILGCVLTLAAASGLPNSKNLQLDEREQSRVTWAYASAYRLWLGVAGVLMLGYVVIDLTGFDLDWPHTNLFGTLPLPGFICAYTLPTALLAWTEPDPHD